MNEQIKNLLKIKFFIFHLFFSSFVYSQSNQVNAISLPQCVGSDVSSWNGCLGVINLDGIPFIGQFRNGVQYGEFQKLKNSESQPLNDKNFENTADIESLKLSALKGEIKAMMELGKIYYRGKVVDKDLVESFKWFKLAANKNNPEAQNHLGFAYSKGIGVNKDVAEAIKWYKLAVAQGDSFAQYNLAFHYKDGVGVPQDLNEAIRLLKLVASSGDKDAQNWIDSINNEVRVNEKKKKENDKINAIMSTGIENKCRRAIESKYNTSNEDKYGRSTGGRRISYLQFQIIGEDNRYKNYGYLIYEMSAYRYDKYGPNSLASSMMSNVDCVYDKKTYNIIGIELRNPHYR